ncbi:Histidine phosphatase superfamily,Histidine phosphatase superfamily, clade-2,Histidine acid [Cinara cedri]|uniref:Multiple inositol polyphosphate phosphatase 1 n=1 Tax=Cinara cedri TaxID=506608 RepID=A0A5E4M789_9HEMI|nr:Histidine phosphatase superfamily,Histidine phosphatase superfamily, clade-2,Histidine acid [Cinara cedri]
MTVTCSLLLIHSLVLAAAVRPGVPSTCYQATPNPSVLFGTKTTYGAVSGNDLHSPSECRPMQLWLMSRHGTRYPSREKIEELKELDRFKAMITADTTMCQEDVEAIRNWNLNLTADNHYMLQRQGVEELKSLAARLKRRLPQLFNTEYDETKFKFLTSAKPRAMDSAKAFFQSMFNKKPEKDIPIAEHSDDRLFLSKCKQKDDDDNEKEQGEAKKFEEGPYMRSIVSRVSAAMGLKQNLSYENVSLMFESCKYEKAWYIQSRPAWCAVFTKDDFEIFEYLEDLKYYYANGYGNPNSEKIGCPILKDLIENFKNLARDKTGPLGIFYFGHSPNVLSVVTRLGIGKGDTPLLSTNFENMKTRKWRTSYIDPFASNVIAVFFRCKDGNKAMFLLNEHAVPMNNGSSQLSPWQPIEAQFDSITSNNSCNLDYCKSSALSFSSMTSTIVIAIVMLTYISYSIIQN